MNSSDATVIVSLTRLRLLLEDKTLDRVARLVRYARSSMSRHGSREDRGAGSRRPIMLLPALPLLLRYARQNLAIVRLRGG